MRAAGRRGKRVWVRRGRRENKERETDRYRGERNLKGRREGEKHNDGDTLYLLKCTPNVEHSLVMSSIAFLSSN